MKGWRIYQVDRFVYRANSGNPEINLKIYTYPEYRQKVVEEINGDFRVRSSGFNRFIVFKKKMPSRGAISIERTASVFPVENRINIKEDWGRISDIPEDMVKKYREPSRYWSLESSVDDDWFRSDSLNEWLIGAWRYLRERIRAEDQERRLGAQEALEKGIGDCDEFTDSLISLARMRGIPCRRLTGVFIRNPKDWERHAWTEIYSPVFGWTTVDIALHNIGYHTINYIVLKVEEFNPAISDYQVRINHRSKVHSHWEIGEPMIEEIR
jgi:hypothetical protein